MDIKIIKDAKRQCESEIRAILNMFEKQSSCVVHAIYINRALMIGGERELIGIELDVRVDYR